MKVFKLIYVFHKIRLLSPSGLFKLLAAIYQYGINLMTLLSFADRAYCEKTALVDENETTSYQQLFSQSEKLSIILSNKYQIKSGQKAGFLCKNHASLVKSIFAASRLGADIYLLNPEMSESQIKQLLDHHKFDFLVYDFEVSSKVDQFNKGKVLSYHDHLPAINNLLTINMNETPSVKRTSMSKIMLLTGGTTGKSKEAAHKPSIFNYLNPFLGLLTRLNLINYKTAYIATPICHGYGVAVLLLFIALGKKVVISNGFNPSKACCLIHEHKVEVITVVPLMINKMIKHNAQALKSLACIASGGAELNPKLVEVIFSKLGDVLYNLYGTSETGLNLIATPTDLKYSVNTIGKKINGVKLKVLDKNKNKVKAGSVGRLCIKNNWSMKNRKNDWIETGDLGFQDTNGYYFLCGRTDDMIVSAGENVYPLELEQVLITHPQVEEVAVIGIDDDTFGKRLIAFVKQQKNASLSKEELFEWLHPITARFQMPKDIIFVENMPYTSLGKLDKKQLKV